MEVQRQQLQAAVDQMEAAVKDPVQGPDNVAIYKQYWDQYSGSLQALSKENPLMHHLLQVVVLKLKKFPLESFSAFPKQLVAPSACEGGASRRETSVNSS